MKAMYITIFFYEHRFQHLLFQYPVLNLEALDFAYNLKSVKLVSQKRKLYIHNIHDYDRKIVIVNFKLLISLKSNLD
jgi:hypothetical protein